MSGQSAKVLICCEPSSGLEAMVPQLQAHGYSVVHAPSIFRAVATHSTGPADVVIIDANHLTDRDYEVFDILRDPLPGVKLFASISISRR